MLSMTITLTLDNDIVGHSFKFDTQVAHKLREAVIAAGSTPEVAVKAVSEVCTREIKDAAAKFIDELKIQDYVIKKLEKQAAVSSGGAPRGREGLSKRT